MLFYYMKELFDIIKFLKRYYLSFIFKSTDPMDEKINKSIMFLIYLSIMLYFISSKISSLPVSILILLLLIKFNYKKEDFTNENNCRKPTIDNPYMNPLLWYDGKEACDADQKEIMNKYNHNLKRNIKDVFEKNNGQPYYKTNNVTTVPNKYKEFLDFIGMTYDEKDNNCKYDGVNCMKYNDLRVR